MKLSRTVIYALRATLQLAQAKSSAPVPCSQLATAGQMPERFLLQVLRQLVTHGILYSTRGVDGGYSLDRKPDEISLLNVIEAVDGPFLAFLPESEVPHQWIYENRLRDVLEQVTATTRRQLESVKLSDLLKTGPAAPNFLNREAGRVAGEAP